MQETTSQQENTFPQNPPIYSEEFKTKGKTYFLDVKAAKNGNKYLSISNSWTSKDGQKHRGSITVFYNDLLDFAKAVAGIQEKVTA